MKAAVGDRIAVKSRHVGEREREATILEIRGQEGAPPYVVRWSDDGHEGLYIPGSDAIVEHIPTGRIRTTRPPRGATMR